MPEVESAADAEAVIRSYYLQVAGPRPYRFETSKDGSEWVVRSSIRLNSADETEEHEWRVESETGRVRFRKLNAGGAEELRARFFRPKEDKGEEKREVKASQEERPQDDSESKAEGAPLPQEQSLPSITDDYRAAAKQTIESEITALMIEEARAAARELAVEETKAIRQLVEQHKVATREALQEEKAAARMKIEEVRRTIVFLAAQLGQPESGAPERTDVRQGQGLAPS